MELKEAIKKIIDNTEFILDELLPRDKSGRGWMCPAPECTSGSGKTGTGLYLKKDTKKIRCFACGLNVREVKLKDREGNEKSVEMAGNIIDLIQEMYHISFIDAVKKACEVLKIELDNKYSNSSENEQRAKKRGYTTNISSNTNKVSKNVKLNVYNNQAIIDAIDGKSERYKQLITQAQDGLESQRARDYLRKRGISFETAKRYGLGYIDSEVNLTKADGKTITVSDSIIFPESNATFSTRSLKSDSERYNAKTDYQEPKSKKAPEPAPDIPFLLSDVVRSKDEMFDGYLKPVYLVEGQFDALSFKEIGLDAISLNGLYNLDKVIEVFKHYDIKRPLLIALDADMSESKSFEKIEQLSKAGIESYAVKFIDESMFNKDIFKDANDYYKINPLEFARKAYEFLEIPYKEFNESFNNAKESGFIERIKDSINAPVIKTGFSVLDSDKFLDGGLYEGLYVIGAISNLGKTDFTLQIADQIATAGHDVLYFSLEMSQDELMARSISRYTNINNHGVKSLSRTVREITDYKRYKNFGDEQILHIDNSRKMYFRDTGQNMRIFEGVGDIPVSKIKSLAEEHKAKRGRAPVIFIDYLQILAPPETKFNMSDKQIVDLNVKTLKQLSRDLHTPIFIISSFNRDNYNNDVSMISFKESGAIEYSSDVLIGLEKVYGREKSKQVKEIYEQKEQDERVSQVRLKILKNRHGGKNVSILYNFHFDNHRFIEIGDEKKQKSKINATRRNNSY